MKNTKNASRPPLVISSERRRFKEGPAGFESGLALITALMVLSFLTILGGALLSTIQIDTKISHNYVTRTQAQYLAEAGIEVARQTLRVSPRGLSANLDDAAGADGRLSTSRGLTTLLDSDDAPLLPEAAALRTAGLSMTDSTGNEIGTVHVFMRTIRPTERPRPPTATALSRCCRWAGSVMRPGRSGHWSNGVRSHRFQRP